MVFNILFLFFKFSLNFKRNKLSATTNTVSNTFFTFYKIQPDSCPLTTNSIRRKFPRSPTTPAAATTKHHGIAPKVLRCDFSAHYAWNHVWNNHMWHRYKSKTVDKTASRKPGRQFVGSRAAPPIKQSVVWSLRRFCLARRSFRYTEFSNWRNNFVTLDGGKMRI